MNFKKAIETFQEITLLNKKTSEKILNLLLEQKDSSYKLINILNWALTVKPCINCGSIISENQNQCERCDRKEIKKLILLNSIRDYQNLNQKVSLEFNFFILNNKMFSLKNQDFDRINTLINYLKQKEIKEVIFSFPPNPESEILFKLLKSFFLKEKLNILLTKIAVGIPFGGSVEYVDEETYSKALERRE